MGAGSVGVGGGPRRGWRPGLRWPSTSLGRRRRWWPRRLPSRRFVRVNLRPWRSEAMTCATPSRTSSRARRRERERRFGEASAEAVIWRSTPPSTRARTRCGRALQARAPLRVREEDAEPARGDPEEQVLEPAGELAVRRLDQEVVAAAAVGRGREVFVGGVLGPREVDLAAGDELHRRRARRRQLGRARGELCRADGREVRADVRRRRQHGHALVRRSRHHLHRLGDRRRPVVDPRQHVGVEVDHL